MSNELTMHQGTALDKLLSFLRNPSERCFALKGYAGTGKTFLLKHLTEHYRSRMIFTAPTNKATKVLRDTLTTDKYRPQCRTIYSLLGLRLLPDGEVRELTVPEDPVDLTQYAAVVVDEGSMVNTPLMTALGNALRLNTNLKVIFVLDPAQLPPVGEDISPVCTIDIPQAMLTEVRRNSGPILQLSVDIRAQIGKPNAAFSPKSSNDGESGIWVSSKVDNIYLMRSMADALATPGKAKIIAWRNATVNNYNSIIRQELFGDEASKPWLIGDRVVVVEPVKDLEGNKVAVTDDEGVIEHVEVQEHPVWKEFTVWRIRIATDDNRVIVLFVLHHSSFARHRQKEEELAAAARTAPRLWAEFWEFKESFHQLRHSYAITAHRSQGSTYDFAFVDWRDILLNRNRPEAYKCLYVACTRPRHRLYLG